MSLIPNFVRTAGTLIDNLVGMADDVAVGTRELTRLYKAEMETVGKVHAVEARGRIEEAERLLAQLETEA